MKTKVEGQLLDAKFWALKSCLETGRAESALANGIQRNWYYAGVPLPERQLISRIRRMAGRSRSQVLTGIGDDCARILPSPGQELLVTTDLCLEGIHFRREWEPAESIGRRCLVRGLSDIAAMGGEPLAAFLSLALPKRLPQKWVDGFLRGFLHLARECKVTLAGGDTSASPDGVLADVMVIGQVPRGRAVLRSTARPGDLIYVTGALGGAAAELEKNIQPQRNAEKRRSSRETRNQKPGTPPRLSIGQYLREETLATAMIDLSDGLSTDLSHICEESGVGAVLVEPLVPVSRGATLKQALHGGEDYELLFTARPSARIPLLSNSIPISEIGWISEERTQLITDCSHSARVINAKGHEHFRKGQL